MSTPAKYVMIFAFSEGFRSILLQHKPASHKNPAFRDRWTAPGGHVETGESELVAAIREFYEETRLQLEEKALRFVLRFACNCDITETEHDVTVFGAMIPAETLGKAFGPMPEPVRIFRELPENVQWYLAPMAELVVARLKQPGYSCI
jgi:8-oxo-dGTP pyrophosphatase MutT (NUDIX family)